MRVVILATRIAGVDGVSLEANRWREILERMGHKVTFVAGKLDRSGILIPELHFQWPEVVELHDRVVYGKGEYAQIEADIFAVAGKIEGKLREIFNRGKKIDLLIVPNALSIPMHFPLAVALARVIEEFSLPVIAHHHDFWWERKRYLKSTLFPFFKRWFPPKLPSLHHVVINSMTQKELKERVGISSTLIWDTFDFSSKAHRRDSFARRWRSDFGIDEQDIVFLHATRIVPRKRIELSIELVKKLEEPKAVLVLAGYSGDEGRDYERKLRKLAKSKKARIKFIGKYINSKRKVISTNNSSKPKHRRIYTLWDCFVNADFVTYPTSVEGFGNQFVETIFFKKPIIITPYPVFKADIAPLGFETITMPHKVTKKVVNEVKEQIDNPKMRQKMVEENFKLGKKYFDYEVVEKKLKKIFKQMELS